jgi:hypothetical protein
MASTSLKSSEGSNPPAMGCGGKAAFAARGTRLTFVCSFAVLSVLLTPRFIEAAVNQPGPGGLAMPQPVRAEELNVVCSRGFPDGRTLAERMGQCQQTPASTPAQSAVSLLGLFNYNNENGMLDPVRDAYTTPGTFSPQCGLSGTIVLHGGSCLNSLGWYNAVENPTAPPPLNQIYPLVPGNPTLPPLMCLDNDFCPLATRMHNQAPNQHTWANPLPEFAAEIRDHPMYMGGLIGFALLPPRDTAGNPMGLCPQIKYSQAELNQKSPSGAPWVTTLIYQSVAEPGAYYIAFEDQPMCPSAWQGGNCGMGNGQNDGDFNDFVFRIKGLSCNLGGDPCEVDDPTVLGICRGGITECVAGGTSTRCRTAVKPTTEKCDALDNDCNGMVDEGDLCPAPGICDRGVCVNRCSATEFPCSPGLACDNGLCRDPRCIGLTCNNDQICLAGICVGGCGPGVVCPHGQRCQLGNCVDACAGVTCATNEVCEDGACQPPCGRCRECKPGRMCNTTMNMPNSGKCLETGCENRNCPAGQVCKARWALVRRSTSPTAASSRPRPTAAWSRGWAEAPAPGPAVAARRAAAAAAAGAPARPTAAGPAAARSAASPPASATRRRPPAPRA